MIFVLLFSILVLTTSIRSQEVSGNTRQLKLLLERWLQEGPSEPIPWKIHLSSPVLSIHQRLVTHVEMELEGKELLNRLNKGPIDFFLQFTDETGRTYVSGLRLKQPLPADAGNGRGTVSWDAFVRPGTFDVALALYQPATNEHNLAVRKLKIQPLKNDPLPHLWPALPNLEFIIPAQEPDAFFQPEIKGVLNLPLLSRRRVEIEVVGNPAPMEEPGNIGSAYQQNLAFLLPMLKTFSQVRVRNGALNVSLVDLAHQVVSFEQDHPSEMDWPQLKKALSSGPERAMVSVRDLRERNQRADFLREVLERKLDSAAEQQMPADDHSVRVLILISGPRSFAPGSHLSPVTVRTAANYLVYYFRYPPMPVTVGRRNILMYPAFQDEVETMLKSLRVRTFNVDTPEHFRKALASMLGEISKL